MAKTRTTRASKTATDAPAPAAPKRARAAAESRSRDGKRLVIVESPAKAKTINKYLGSEYVVKASMGHVRDLPSKGLGVDLEHDFQPTYELLPGRRKVMAELKKAAKSAPEIYLATDMDREGEAIAWHLSQALEVPPERQKRVVFNEITKTAIRAAFEHPGQLDGHKVDAQQARRILDRIVGYQVSPLLWRKVATGLSAGRVQTVAVRLIVEREREIAAFMPEEYWKLTAVFTARLDQAGQIEQDWRALLSSRNDEGQPPAQAQLLAFLAERAAFRAELVEYQGAKFAANQEAPAVAIAQALGLAIERVDRVADPKGKGPAANRVSVVGRPERAGRVKYQVESVSARASRSHPPAPFTTASMQQAASVQLRFSASRTMSIAQQLYEGVELPGEGSVGLITYMRTDSTNLSGQAIGQAREFIEQSFGARYLPEKPNVYASGPRAQAAHEAVRPTDVARTPDALAGVLDEAQLRLYRLIWQRFVACQMASAEWNVTDVQIRAAGADAKQQPVSALFKTSGRQLAFDGYYRVTGLPRADEPTLPPLTQAQPVAPVQLDPTQHFTMPPPRYTEASLVKALEAEGIGRPSTYAAIIQTIQDRQYVQQLDRKFHATELGMKVTDKLVKAFPDVFDIRFTAQMEDRLDQVEEAKADWVRVLHDFYGPFKTDLERAHEEMVHAKAETEPSAYVCPTCGKPLVYRWSKTGKYLACTGYPECKFTSPVDGDGKMTPRKEVDTPCPQCGKKMMLRRSRFGPFLGCSDYPNCKGTLPSDDEGKPLKLVKDEEVTQACPECGGTMTVRRKGRRAFLGCGRYPECKATAPIPAGIRLASPPRAEPQKAGVDCPKCGKPMLIRESRRGPFVACSGYPRCRNAYDISKLDELKAGKVPEKTPAKK